MSSRNKTVQITPRKSALVLFYILIVLIIAHLTGQTFKYIFGHGSLFGLVPMFDFNTEQNIPTFFSVLLLTACSVLFLFIWRSEKKQQKNQWVWVFLAIVFCFLAIDEFGEIHEKLSEPFHERFQTQGLLYYAWVIPYGMIVLILTLFFLPVWWRMKRKIRNIFAIAAIFYIMGAIGMEMLGGREFENMGDQLNYKCAMLAAIEESLEMGALIILIYGQLKKISGKDAFLILLGKSFKTVRAENTLT